MSETKPEASGGIQIPAERIDAAVERGLSARTQGLIDRSEAESTRYNRGLYWALFDGDFCANYGGRGPDGTRYRGLRSLPASPETLAEFVGWMAHRGYVPSTIKLALAAVRWKHRATGEPVPDGVKASAAVRGYQDEMEAGGWRPKRSAPARTRELECLVGACDLDTAQGVRDRAMVLLGYSLAARRVAIVRLDLIDLRQVDNRTYRVNIYRDKGGTKRSVPLSHWGTPRQGWCRDPLCPLCAVLAWVAILNEHGIERGPMFRPIDKGGNIAGIRPVAGGHDEQMSVTAVNIIFTRLRKAAGLPPDVTPHSLRAGFATETYEKGGDQLAIRRRGGWSDKSTAFYIYIREVDDVAMDPLQHVVAARRRSRAKDR